MALPESAHQSTSPHDVPDIYKGFEGQRTPSSDDYVNALLGGLIVVDANVLLDLYRYNETGRRSLLSTFRALGPRLWVPHQALQEFWSNREEVLRDPQGKRGLLTTLEKTEATAVQSIHTWAKHSAQPEDAKDQVVASVRSGFESAREQISARSDGSFRNWLTDTNADPVLEELESLLQGKVGAPLDEVEYATAIEEALRRVGVSEPPGYKDKHKSDPKAAGDYLIWVQTLREAASRGLDVLFITRDLKEDWVRRKDDELSGPRSELVQEMLKKSGRRFFLRSPAGILELARNNMSVDVSDESLADARRLNDTEVSIPRIIHDYNWIRMRSGWDVASVENLMEALEAGSPHLGGTLVRLATTDEIVDEQSASELGIDRFGQIRSELDQAIEVLQSERLISHSATSPLLPVMKRPSGGVKVDVQGYRLRDEFRTLLLAIIENSEALYLWRRLDDDRLTSEIHRHISIDL